MKNLLIICVLAQALFFVSCQKEEQVDIVEVQSFVGIWRIAQLDCSGVLGEWEDYQDYNIVISENTTNDDLRVDFGDGVIFDAHTNNGNLVIERQTLNEGGDFDVVTLSAVAEMREDETIYMEFTHSVDDEGLSQCSMYLREI